MGTNVYCFTLLVFCANPLPRSLSLITHYGIFNCFYCLSSQVSVFCYIFLFFVLHIFIPRLRCFYSWGGGGFVKCVSYVMLFGTYLLPASRNSLSSSAVISDLGLTKPLIDYLVDNQEYVSSPTSSDLQDW